MKKVQRVETERGPSVNNLSQPSEGRESCKFAPSLRHIGPGWILLISREFVFLKKTHKSYVSVLVKCIFYLLYVLLLILKAVKYITG